MTCIIILPSAILLCISSVFLLENQLLATKVEQKIALVILYYSQSSIFAPTSFFHYFSKVILRKSIDR